MYLYLLVQLLLGMRGYFTACPFELFWGFVLLFVLFFNFSIAVAMLMWFVSSLLAEIKRIQIIASCSCTRRFYGLY